MYCNLHVKGAERFSNQQKSNNDDGGGSGDRRGGGGEGNSPILFMSVCVRGVCVSVRVDHLTLPAS